MSIFLDTGFYIAFYNSKDKYHSRAKEIYNELKNNKYGKIYTSTDVLDELFTYFQRMISQSAANEIASYWFEKNQRFGSVLFPNESILSKAAGIFSKQIHERKALSFTDCLIIATCKEANISNLVSFESGFHNMINVIQ